MALPASGPISMSMVRTEMSQSFATNYTIGRWTWGDALISPSCAGFIYTGYAPINVLSSGSRFSESSPLNLSNLSMSAWYNYNHSAQINTGVTGTLYQHADVTDTAFLSPTSMLVIELGTSNTTYSINISGSNSYNEYIYIFNSRPWANFTGTNDVGHNLVYQGTSAINTSFNYNYTYNSISGSKLYCVLANGFFTP